MAGNWLKQSLLSETPAQPRMEAKLGRVIGSKGFTGEKNLGELGPLKEYIPEYSILRARSWQLFMESEIIQTIYGKYETYVIGKGIKAQCEPVKQILEHNKIKVKPDFSEMLEARFSLHSNSKRSDYAGMTPLNHLQKEAYKNSKIGGDVLVILRVEDDLMVTVQLIDGAHVQSPRYGSEVNPNVLPNGNRIVNGIELDEKGQHIAYHVVQQDKNGVMLFDYKRILARNPKNGMVMAYMVYGYKYRIDNERGMPLFSVMFETIAKMERYKEAAVGGAEERQKIAFTVEHDITGTGENIFANTTVRAYDNDRGSGLIPETDDGTEIANKMAVSTNKQVFNMPRGAKVNMHEPGAEQSFGEFYKTNFNFIAAANRIPAEVALSMFNANYSASRASLNDWGETTMNEQDFFGGQFIKPIFDLFAHIAILNGQINAPDYTLAYFAKQYDVVEAFLNCRFLGPRIKHIDPLKEVNAERAKLGPLGAHLPLTTVEDVVENLGGRGESDSNMEQFAEEVKLAEGFGLKPIPVAPKPSAPKP